MKTIEINAVSREKLGKKSTNNLRAEGNVPCVMYGGKENLHFYAHVNEFKNLVYTPDVHLVKLVVDGKSHEAILKDIQFHPVSDKILHIDFLQVSDDKPVTIEIPIKITGESIGVKAGGKMRVRRRTLKVKGMTSNFPEHLTIDITNLEIGQSIRIGDLAYENLEIIDNKRSMIVAVATSRVAMKEEGAAGTAESAAEETPAAEQPANK